ncbi:hypothetical protein IFM89_008282 [Coptis chinensis]|uniref:Pectate lyase n=1 Tax=Coptis chinensis TaxID=261450 RepID=A0A835GY07_9MAGN|nr:hypothetical protein IFM89_008282 [Coptis chinensis]
MVFPIPFIVYALLAFLASTFHAHPVYKTYNTVPTNVQKQTMNQIDSCWRSNPDWVSNRRDLADCPIGFGNAAIGGKYGAIYEVTDPSDNPIIPKPGTLRFGVIQEKPLWIVFSKDMVITLENELIMSSFKTIDGRGAKVEIANGPCITIQEVSHIIIHGINIHDCKPSKGGLVRSNTTHIGHRLPSDGDGITIFASNNIWIDHCFLSRCTDGLVDVTHASTDVTISNNFFTQHDKVMLLGHDDAFTADKLMRVTVVFNYFGPDLVQRMPRVRLGYAHVTNNRYEEWMMYAIGGSANPTILSEGNYFNAPNNPYFKQSGWGSCPPLYSEAQSFTVSEGSLVPALTAETGPLLCTAGYTC